MFSLRGRQDGFRIRFPKEFICDEIVEKYTKVLTDKHSFITNPIDFLNETIQSVQVLGFSDATVQQQQTGRGTATINNRPNENRFLHTSSDTNYRSEKNPIALIDKTLNITFRHTLGYVNYFLLFENFFYIYMRDKKYENLIPNLFIDILDNSGNIYSRIEIIHPVIDSMDMLQFDYTQPVAASQTFMISFKYSNIDFQFIENDDSDELKLPTFI